MVPFRKKKQWDYSVISLLFWALTKKTGRQPVPFLEPRLQYGFSSVCFSTRLDPNISTTAVLSSRSSCCGFRQTTADLKHKKTKYFSHTGSGGRSIAPPSVVSHQLVGWLVHHFGPELNISTTSGRISVKFWEGKFNWIWILTFPLVWSWLPGNVGNTSAPLQDGFYLHEWSL